MVRLAMSSPEDKPEDKPANRPADKLVPRRRPNDADTGWAIVGTLVGGMVVWGGIGWLIGRVLGLPVLMPVGALIGLAAAVYLVYVRLMQQ